MESKNHYRTLGIPSTASQDAIKIAYRKLSKKFHPDFNQGDIFFEEKFKEIQEAYEILSNDEKRKNYDSKNRQKERSNNYSKNKQEEELKAKTDEFKKQKEHFKKWEESLREKEENIKQKVSIHKKQKIAIAILTMCLIGAIFSLGFFVYNDKNKTSKNENKIFLAPVNNTKPSGSELLNILEGTWTGKGLQYDISEVWSIRLVFDPKNEIFTIEYPSLGCRGKLSKLSESDSEIQFKESIENGLNFCTNNGIVKLKKINNNKLEYLYYRENSSVINAKGVVIKK